MFVDRRSLSVTLGAALLLLCSTSAALGVSPEDKCEADKNKFAGKYAFCRQNAEAKAIKKGVSPDYAKCDSKLVAKWAKIEQKAIDKGTACTDSVTDTAIQAFVTAHSDAVATALDGGAVPDCGDGIVNVGGEQCDGADLDGYTCNSFGLFGTLGCDGSCDFDASNCSSDCAGAGGVEVGGACWFASDLQESCTTVCASLGAAYDEATLTYAGSDGTTPQCDAVLTALGYATPAMTTGACITGAGCINHPSGFRIRCTSVATSPDASQGANRACACSLSP